MLETISLAALSTATGGNGATASWDNVRSRAGEHCPRTAALYPDAPQNRAAAETMGNACLREMGPLKRAMGGTRAIRNGLDEAFPR